MNLDDFKKLSISDYNSPLRLLAFDFPNDFYHEIDDDESNNEEEYLEYYCADDLDNEDDGTTKAIQKAIVEKEDYFTFNNKGGNKFFYDGYYYVLDCVNQSGKHLWKCERCNKTKKYIKCNARVHTIDGKPVKFVNEHNHLPVPDKKQVYDTVHDMKQKAKITKEKPRSIITTTQTRLNEHQAVMMVRKKNLTQRINYQRSSRIDSGPSLSK